MSDFPFEPGDSFEGSPIQLGYYISDILAAGGSFKYEGNTVVILTMPGKAEVGAEPEVKDEPKPEPEVKDEPKPEPEPEPEVKDEPKTEDEAKSEDEAKTEVEAEEAKAETPKRGRPRKASSTEED